MDIYIIYGGIRRGKSNPVPFPGIGDDDDQSESMERLPLSVAHFPEGGQILKREIEKESVCK
jgi:hypothetical protein